MFLIVPRTGGVNLFCSTKQQKSPFSQKGPCLGLGGSIARTVRNGYRFDPTHCEGREYGASRLHDGGFGGRGGTHRRGFGGKPPCGLRERHGPDPLGILMEGRALPFRRDPFIAKTDDDRFEALAARVRALHSYETPCIVALPVARGMRIFSLGSPNQHIRRNDVHLCRRLAGFRPYHVL